MFGLQLAVAGIDNYERHSDVSICNLISLLYELKVEILCIEVYEMMQFSC